MNDLNQHVRLHSWLGDDWSVVDADLDLSANQVTTDLEHSGGKLGYPECSSSCSRSDTAPKRTWRHLDMMQFPTKMRSRLEPIKKVARILKTHLPGRLSYFNHDATNALSEEFNSKIQSIRSAARGFHSFKNDHLRILFDCGKLDLGPVIPSH